MSCSLSDETKDELGGSHLALQSGAVAAEVSPKVDADPGEADLPAVHEAIAAGLVRSCHDLSEGRSGRRGGRDGTGR